MRKLLRSIVLAAFLAGTPGAVSSYDNGLFLNFALGSVPPGYLAEIPLEDRPDLLSEIFSDPKNPFVHTEGSYLRLSLPGEEGKAKPLLWAKLLPRTLDPDVQHPYSPLVYLHFANPIPGAAEEEDPLYEYETHILMWDPKHDEGPWVDVTEKFLPASVDPSLHLPPVRDHYLIEIREEGRKTRQRRPKEVLVWSDWKLHPRKNYPYYSTHRWEAPFDSERLAVLALLSKRDYDDDRELAQLLVRAGMERDERFRLLLGMDHLREVPLLACALASYEYALDRSEEAIDFMVEQVAKEGNGDTNAKWMLHYFDEWDRTLEIYHEFDGTDGAAAEASVAFANDRQFFYPKNFEKFWKKKHEELHARE